MKVILLTDVKNVGKKDEVKEVADGYGRNYLIRNRLAVEASKRSLEILDKQNDASKAEYEQKKVEAEAVKVKLESLKLTFDVTAGNDGKIFGSVSASKIAETLETKYGISIDKRKIIGNNSLTKLGHYDVRVELFKEVIATISVDVVDQSGVK